jgi:hypothetical protein
MMLNLSAEEQREYDRLTAADGYVFGESRVLAARARRIVAERNARKKTQTLRELAVSSLGWKEKLAVVVLWRWAKENGMDFLGKILKLSALDGYRMYAAGAASILGGLALVALAFANDPRGDLKQGYAAIVAGLAIIGKAGKDDKQIAATTNAKGVAPIAVQPRT